MGGPGPCLGEHGPTPDVTVQNKLIDITKKRHLTTRNGLSRDKGCLGTKFSLRNEIFF